MDDIRVNRMIDSAPIYYQFSGVFRQIQRAQASEYYTLEEKNEDLRTQLYIQTATWGLKYWEEIFGIRTIESDSYPIRRSRVLSRRRGLGQFSANLVKTVCEAYSNGEVTVNVDSDVNNVINITFVGARGIPPNLDDLKEIVADIVHAHLGAVYNFTYLPWSEFDSYNKTWNQWDALNLIWDDFEKYREGDF